MTKNPIINAIAAMLYISLVAVVMFYGMDHTGSENSVIVPIAVVSLFTLSAAVMGYLFLSTPLQLYLDGKKKAAINLFLQTVAVFGVITTLVFAVLFSRILA